MKKYPCPKCGKNLTRGPKAQSGKRRWQCKTSEAYCYSTTNPESLVTKTKTTGPTPKFDRKLRATKRYLITSAQNATPIHDAFWASLLAYAKEWGAELLVIPLRYKNPTSTFTASQSNDEVWDAKVTPYLWNQRKDLNKNLKLMADIKTQPTASDPLSGFEAISHSESCIFGHTKVALRTIPAPNTELPKLMVTTGACTRANYTDSKAGKLGEFHHTLGAVVVEIDGGTSHLRNVNGSKTTGEFYDIAGGKVRVYGPKGGRKGERPEALICGDVHERNIDPQAERASFAPKTGMVARLQPRRVVYHDLLDAESCNPHHRGNPFIEIAKRSSGRHDVQAEVEAALQFVIDRTTGDIQSVIVDSNHDDMLTRWISSTDWRLLADRSNSLFYLKTAAIMAEGTSDAGEGSTPAAFRYWAEKAFKQTETNAICLGPHQSFVVAGVALDMHGHRGPNGARGSIKNLRRVGVRSIIGHGHGPGINEGCYQVGTKSKLRLGYNVGPSNWLHTDCVLHADGKRQLINIIRGEWYL